MQGFTGGELAIVGACFAWAIDNNLTRKVSAGDPVQIAMLKGLVAGSVNTAIGLSLGNKLPGMETLMAIGSVGLFGYGISHCMFVLALRYLGTARTGAYFSIAPFVGAIISAFIFPEQMTAFLVMSGGLMTAGVWLHLTEKHEHLHRHAPLEHEHLHWHDEHHQHSHGIGDLAGEPHSHQHRHAELLHSHPHFPDIHHQHSH